MTLKKQVPDTQKKVPSPTPLTEVVADSKPLPWWTVKYKTRWFADASIVAGKPLVIDILWNEIGRGTDLRALDVLIFSPRASPHDLKFDLSD